MNIQDSSDEERDLDIGDVCNKPSPSKYPEAVTILAKLPNKPKDLRDVIGAAKSLVKCMKLVCLSFQFPNTFL